jgi:hypothetical protein
MDLEPKSNYLEQPRQSFFGKDSVCTSSLNQLLTMIGRNKKSFQDQIALDEFFSAKFLFAIDKQVQHWLRLCKTAHNSRTQVNKRILQFKDLIDTVLNGTFHMKLPPSFAKVNARRQHCRHQQKASKPMAKKEEAKTEKDGRNGKVMTEMETLSRTLCSPLSSNLPPGNCGRTTLQ